MIRIYIFIPYLVIAALSMLIDIETFFLYAGIHTESMQLLDTEEQHHTAGCCPKVDTQHSKALGTEESPTMTVQCTIAR